MSGMDTYGPPAPDPEPEGNLQPESEVFYPTVEQGPRYDQRAANLYDSEIKARASGNVGLADAYQDQQREIMVLGQGLGAAQGIAPSAPLSTSSQVDPNLEIYRQLYGHMEREQKFRQLFEQHNVAELGSYLDTVLQDYKGQQDAPNIANTERMSMDERIELMKRLEPVVRDPNEIAEIHQRLTQLDQAMKAIDPENRTISVFNHPRTARIAKWLARESTSTTAGYLASGPQKLELGEGGWKGAPITMAFAEGVVGFGMEFLGGIVEGTGRAMDAITGGKVSWAGPTNYIEDANGNLVFNGGKIPSVVSVIAAVNAQMLHRNVEDWLAKKDAVRGYIDRVAQARNWEHAQSKSFDKIVRGAAGVAGMGFGFGLPAGAAMRSGQQAANFGNLLTKGLLRMAEGGSSARMVKLTKVMAETAGAGVANGLLEMTAFGRADGLDKAFMHGMAMAPVLMAFGALGRKSESVLSHPYMPKWMSRAVSGGIEGVGFGALEQWQTGALWHLMQDPSQTTWEIYAKNMLGFAIFKAGVGRSVTNAPGFGEQASREMTRQAGRQGLAEEVSRHDERQRGGSVLDEIQGPPVPKGFEMGGRSARPEMPEDLQRIKAKDVSFRSEAEKERLKKWSIETENARRESYEPPRGERIRGEQVEGRAPTSMDPKEQIKGKLPGPEEQLRQAQRGELNEGEFVETKEVLSQRTKKAQNQGFDPLEDPNFKSRPEGERREIMKGGTAIERRKIAEKFQGPEKRESDRREDLQDELLRIKAEGPTPKNRQRVIELLNEARGTVTEAGAQTAEQLRRQVEVSDPQFKGERPDTGAPVTERQAVMRKETKVDIKVRKNLEARVKATGAPRELLRELGDVSRARRAARTPEEARELEARQRRIELELDALEMAQDPVMNATMREALAEESFRQIEEAGPAERRMETEAGPAERATFEAPQPDVDRAFGERFGPDSMREKANPHRQLEDIREKGQDSVRVSEILNVLKGRAGFPGIRIFKWRVGPKREPSAVQVAIRAGRIGGKRTQGVFKVFENLTRTKEGMDLVVSIHEWGHAMMRQVLFGDKRSEQQRAAETKMWKATPPELQDEMRYILRNYPGAEKFAGADTLSEAWAEWHARNILGDPTLRAEVPKLSVEWDAWLRNQPRLLEQYRAAKELVELYKNQGARERVSMLSQRKDPRVRKAVRRALKGDFVERAINKAEETVWDSLVKGFFDDMHMLKKSQRKWLSLSDIDPRSLSILDDPARLHDVLAMTASKQADSYITRGRHNLGFKRTGEGLKEIMDDVVKDFKPFDLKGKRQKRIDFIDYVVATRALELIAAGKKQTLPKSDFLQAHKELTEANPEFRGLADRMKLWSDGLLDLVAEAGNLAPKDLQLLKDFGTVYIPFIRAMEGTVESRFSRGVAEKGNSLRRMKGDKREIRDPMEAMMEVTRTMIVKAHQQMVMKALYKMTLMGDVGGLATRVKRENVAQTYRLDQVYRKLRQKVLEGLELEGVEIEEVEGMDEAFGMLGELIKEHDLSDQLLTLFSQKAFPVGEGNVVAYTPRLTEGEIANLPKHRQGTARNQNGKMQWLELDADAFKALMGLDQPIGPTYMDNVWMKWAFQKPKNWVRFWATDANPLFVAANAIRDVLSAPVFSQDGSPRPWQGATKFMAGAATVFATSRLAGKLGYEASEAQQQFMQMYDASGAKVSSIFDQGVRREMRGEIVGILGGASEIITRATEGWKNWLGSPESFIRISEFERVYKEAMAAGKGEVEGAMEALEAAKEATVNFARAGTVSRGINQMVPYWSAAFAGQRTMLRSLAGMEGKTDLERGVKSSRAMLNAVAAITVPAFAAWMIHHEEDWYRDLPEWRKRHFINTRVMGQILSIPLPFELGVVAGSLPVMAMDAMTDSNPISMIPTIGAALFPYISGLGGFIPPAAKAALEVATGQDLYQMRELTPYWMSQSRAPEDQMRRGTAQAFRGLFTKMPGTFQAMGVNNPIELQQIFSTMTAGGVPTLANLIEDLAGVKNHPGVQPGAAEIFMHFINRFTRQTAHGGSRTANEFYRMFDEVEAQAKRKTATPNDKVELSQMRREREAMAEVRRQMSAGRLTREEGDRRIFEIANKRTGMVK